MNKLYHYTSINSLALILKSRTIRFGRLDQVNDPTEGAAKDFHSLSPYIFISCWTGNQEENLALWNMYTPNMKGVRIELNTPIFNSKTIGSKNHFLADEQEFLNEQEGYCILGCKNEPYKIVYTNDNNLLEPSIRTNFGLHLASLAKYKRKIWTVEKEYRYRMDILPIDKSKQSDHFPDRYEHLIEKKIPPPINSYFVKISNKSFSRMKIRCSPKLEPGDIEIIEALKMHYNKTATIQKSKLTGLIR